MQICIAEDDPDQAALPGLWLEGACHAVSAFGTAAAYSEALKKERFEWLLIDWMLPEGTGAELLQWACANLGWEIPVLVVTPGDRTRRRRDVGSQEGVRPFGLPVPEPGQAAVARPPAEQGAGRRCR